MNSTSNRSLQSYFQEGIVIVASILVAFALDASWDRYQEAQIERRILLELHDEFESAKARIVGSIAQLDSAIRASTELLEYLGPENADLTRDAAEALLIEIFSVDTLEVPSSVLSSIVATGQFRLITDDGLRNLLSEWPALVADVRENHDWHRQSTDEMFVPYIAKHLSIRNTLAAWPRFDMSRSLFVLDPVQLQRDPVFEGLLAWRIIRQQAALSESKVLLSGATKALAMIARELERDSS